MSLLPLVGYFCHVVFGKTDLRNSVSAIGSYLQLQDENQELNFTLFVAGFTQQYRGLNALLDKIASDEGNITFSIAAFPCNQFGLQGLHPVL